MSMKYPFLSNLAHIESTREPDEFMVVHFRDEPVAIVTEEDVYYAGLFDGKTDPAHIFYGKDQRWIENKVNDLVQKGLIRKTRVLCNAFPKIMITLKRVYNNFGQETETEEKNRIKKMWICRILNYILMFSFIPVLVFAVIYKGFVFDTFIYPDWLFTFRYPLSVMMIILCVMINMVIHEGSHSVSNIGYGGRIFEWGVIPFIGFYTLMDQEGYIKGRLRRIQVDLAGIEGNILFGSILYILAKSTNIPFLFRMFRICFLISLTIAFVNASFWGDLDGKRAIDTILGIPVSQKGFDVIGSLLRLVKKKGINTRERINARVSIIAVGLLMLFGYTVFASLIAWGLAMIVSFICDPSSYIW